MKTIIYILDRKKIKAIMLISLLSLQMHAQSFFGYNVLDTNNVSARILNGGDIFWDLAGNSAFEVPKGSGKHTIFAAGLWVGGIDGNGNLKVAVQTYRQNGSDFWPGPIDTNYAPGTFNPAWDTAYKVNKSTVQYHLQHYNDPGYVIPSSIATWPANGYPGTAPVLAPFIDLNGNQIYEPASGEAPYILGDQACYAVFNDSHIPGTLPSGDPLGIEVHAMFYEFVAQQDSVLNNTVLVNYKIGNRSSFTYDSLFVGLFNDFDLGFYNDDYSGTDVGRDMIYCYNGDSVDDFPDGYGPNPPVQGLVFLSHPLANSVSYISDNILPNGNPYGINDSYNYLTGTWRDGVPISFGGNGYTPGNPDLTHFMYPGTTEPNHPGQDWTELIAGNLPSDKRTVGSVGPFTLAAGSYLSIDAAWVYARDTVNPWPNGSITALQNGVDQLRQLYNSGALSITNWTQRNQERLVVYPNPVSSDNTTINLFLPSSEKYHVIIVDLLSKKVFDKNLSGNNLYHLTDVSLARGSYIVQAISKDKMLTSKLIVK